MIWTVSLQNLGDEMILAFFCSSILVWDIIRIRLQMGNQKSAKLILRRRPCGRRPCAFL